MSDQGLNLEIWTLPNSGDFKRKADITPWVIDRNLDIRFLDLSSGGLVVSNDCPYLDQILTVDSADHTNDAASTLMVFRDTTWLASFVFVEREDRSSETEPFTTFGLEGMEWFLERARVRAFDYDANPIREGDWLFGAPSILKAPGGEIANDITNIYRDASVSSGTFKVTDGTTTSTSTVSWDDDGSELKAAVEELTAVTAATVYGIGTEDFPWVAEITDPAGTPFTITVTASTLDGDLFVNPIRQGGDYSPRPYHGSVDPVAGVTVGGYEAFELVTPGGDHPASSSDLILHLDGSAPSASGDNPGFQIESPVFPLHRYRSGMRLNAPDSELELRLSVRDLSNNTIATIDYTLNPAQGWQTIPIVDPANPSDPAGIFTTPNIDTVYVRVGILAEEGVNPGSLYLDYLHEGTYLSPGDAAKNLGEIMDDLLAPITARGVLDWLGTSWDGTDDSSSEAWDQDLAVGIRRGQTFYQVIEYFRRWNYEWTITFDGADFNLNLYNPGNAGTNYDGLGGPSISSLDSIDGGVKTFRAPNATYAIAEGDAGHWGEGVDADLATGWGRLETYFANRQNREGLSTLAARMVSDAALASTGRRVRVQNPATTPLDTIKIGDTVPTILNTASGETETESKRVMGITIGQGDEPAPFYDYHLDSMVFTAEAAEADGVRTLIRAYEALDNLGSGSSIDPLFTYQPPPPASVYTEAGNALSVRGTATSVSNSTSEHQLNIPDGTSSGDFLIYIATIRRNAGDPEINPPSGWTLRVDGGGINTLWPVVMTKVADGTETDTTYTTNLATDIQASAGVTIAIPAPESEWTHTIDLASLLRFGSPTETTAIPFPAVTLSGGSRQYKILGAMFNIESIGNYDVTDYGTMTEVADHASGGSQHGRVQVGGIDQAISGSFTPADWTADEVGNGFSLTMAIHGQGAAVAEGDHAHVESEVTDHTSLSQKATPVAADLVKIYDSEDSNTAKYSELGDLPAGTHTHTESEISDLVHWTETDHDALDHTGLSGVGGEPILHGADPQSDGSLRFRYGVDASGRPTYTAAGTTDTEAIVLLGDNGRPFVREVTL